MLANRLRSLGFGLTLPLRAAGVIFRHPKLIFWSVLPVGVTLAFYFFVITRLQDLAQNAVSGYLGQWGLDPQGWIAWVALVVTKILLFLVGAFTFSIVSSIAASPFNDFLAESAEPWTSPPLPAVRTPSLAGKARIIAIDMAKTGAALLATVAALLLSWVPLVNVVAFGLAFLLVCFQYTSYPQTRRGQGIAHGAWFLWRHLFACAGFGAALSVLFAIPILSSLCVPLAVVGGTLLVGRAQSPGLK